MTHKTENTVLEKSIYVYYHCILVGINTFSSMSRYDFKIKKYLKSVVYNL